MSDLTQRLTDALSARYRIERELGQGGMATVFLAEDLKHRRRVALKVLDDEVASAIGPARFLREIGIVAGLTHPHILALHDSGEADGLLYFVMPYMAGRSLRDRLAGEPQLPLEEALRITREVADALGYAHARGVVHRDVKPGNILLEAGHALLADFGLARAPDGAQVTVTGTGLGTPAYASPEQVVGGSPDPRSDLYSLGCVLYEMLAGQPPFTGSLPESLVFQHLNAAPPRVTAIRPGVPAGLDAVIAKALAKSPADRYASAAEFVSALDTAVAGPAAGGTRERQGGDERRRKRLRVTALAAGTLAVAAVAAIAVVQGRLPWGGREGRPTAAKDWILVAEFEGPPGDSTLAPAARSLLSAALDQSPRIATVPPDQIRQALASAGKPRNARLDPELAAELAYRSSVRAVLEGTFGRLGRGYSIVLRVMDADTPRVILARSGTAKDEDDLIPALGEMAKQLRKGLGENRHALRATREMRRVATPSFEAYRFHVQGSNRMRSQAGGNREALRYFRAALALDRDFASAWFAMGFCHINLGYPDSARACLEEALRRPDRLTPFQSERVRLVLAGLDGDHAAVAAAYDRILAEDPGDVSTLAMSNNSLLRVGRIEDALGRTRRAMRLNAFGPTDGMRINEVADLQYLGRFDEAREANRKNGSVFRELRACDIEAAAERWAAAESIATAHLGHRVNSDYPGVMQQFLGQFQFARGRVLLAASTLEKCEEVARAAADPVGVDYARRNLVAGHLASDGLLPLPRDTWAADTSTATVLTRGLRAAAAGDPRLARLCLAEVRSRPPRRLVEQGDAPALLEARLELLARRPEQAVRLLRPAAVRRAVIYDNGVRAEEVRWVLADAFERLEQPDSAAFYLERSFAIPFRGGWLLPYVHRRLALLYARLGRIPDAERNLAAAERAWDQPDPAVRRLLEEARSAVQAARGMARPLAGAS